MKLRLLIDDNVCQGHGRCCSMNAPGLLHPDDDGFVTPRGQEIPVPPAQEGLARDAVAGCPESAIRLVED